MKAKMQITIAILSFIFLTIPVALLDIVVKLLGIPMVLISLPFAKEKQPPEWKWGGDPHKDLTYPEWKFVALPEPFQSIWGSDKYGAMGNWIWKDRNPTSFWKQYEWLAIRNAGSNWSYTPLMRYKAHSDNIRHLGSDKIDDNKGITGWRFTWDVTCPWRSGLVVLKRYGKSTRGLWARLGWLQYSEGGEHVPSLKSMFIPHFFKKIPWFNK